MKKRNTAREKRKRNKGFPYKSQLPWDYVNKRNKYLIVVKRTGEVLDNFRTKATATLFLSKWKNILKEEVEIKENEEL